MPNVVLDQIRQKYPEYRGYADDVLARAIAEKYPEYRPYLREFLGTPSTALPQTPATPSQSSVPQRVGDYISGQARYLVNPTANESGQTFGSGFAKVFADTMLGGGITPAMGAAANAATSALVGKVAPTVRGLLRPGVARTATAEAPAAAKVATGVAEVGAAAPTQAPAEISATQKVLDALKAAKPVRAAQEAGYSAERSRRLAQAMAVGAKTPGEAGYIRQLGALKGELPKVNYESIRGAVTQPDIDALFNQVEGSKLLGGFEKITAKTGLAKLFGAPGVQVPTRGELDLLGRVFGEGFVKEVLAKRPLLTRTMDTVTQAIGVPRALMASLDFSAPFRQGLVAGAGYPRQFFKAFPDMFRSAFSEKAYQALNEEIVARPTYNLMSQGKLALSGLARGAQIANREEQFITTLAERIPGIGRLVGASDRAYTGFLTKLRADVFDELLKRSKQAGVEQSDQLINSISEFVNTTTGRGSLGGLELSGRALSSVLFSPRLMASRLQTLNPNYYVRLDPFVRKEALKSALSLTAAGSTVLGLASVAGVQVGLDPRSADFGKIRMGNTRVDIWGGFQQYPRLLAQMISGQVVSSTTGKTLNLGEGYRPLTRLDIAQRALESKANPVVGFAIRLLRGRGFDNMPLVITNEVRDLFTPMVLQDAIDIANEDPHLLPLIVPGAFGVGVQTYGPKKR